MRLKIYLVVLFLRRWWCHAMLNLGMALDTLAFGVGRFFGAVWYGIIPPQLTHTKEDVVGLEQAPAWQWFLWGIGIGPHPLEARTDETGPTAEDA